MNKAKKIAVIGSGFSGLSTAAYLAKAGYDVEVYEKNETVGGRARQFADKGFLFDMGPSWYWMPDVMESFYNDFGFTATDFYQLEKLTPAFDMVFGEGNTFRVPESFDELKLAFESKEKGSSEKLELFMEDARVKYEVSMKGLIQQPGLSPLEYVNIETIKNAFKLSIFSSFRKHVKQHFNHPELRALMEFPVLFLGAQPKDTPALYSLMNYAGLKLGTWYPKGGFFSIIKAMQQVCEKNGVIFHTNAEVKKIHVANNQAVEIEVGTKKYAVDAVVGSADYHHIETNLIDPKYRNYPENYWDKKVFAPSSLIFYLGVNKKLEKLNHHTLFFDRDLDQHANEIYENKAWPKDPLFYVCTPSKTDEQVAPSGKENLFLLMPLATGLEDTPELREKYFLMMLERLEKYTGEEIKAHIEVKHSYCIKDFKSDYNAYGGNAYGLANTLTQTAFMKPKIINKRIKNLIYAGQLTVPGPGVPPAIISGKIAAALVQKTIKNTTYEIAI